MTCACSAAGTLAVAGLYGLALLVALVALYVGTLRWWAVHSMGAA